MNHSGASIITPLDASLSHQGRFITDIASRSHHILCTQSPIIIPLYICIYIYMFIYIYTYDVYKYHLKYPGTLRQCQDIPGIIPWTEHPIGGWSHLFTFKEQVEARRQGPRSRKIRGTKIMSRLTTERWCLILLLCFFSCIDGFFYYCYSNKILQEAHDASIVTNRSFGSQRRTFLQHPPLSSVQITRFPNSASPINLGAFPHLSNPRSPCKKERNSSCLTNIIYIYIHVCVC